ncbi:hypothetical protein IGI04_024710 [Brassica rapa subsp. trilocularis]|uniref:Uncharacterized protein n=1 Tax=Brassica rapa subsp. trilocularis TaxID=1813537 RepID=A0ABQ7M7H2_BRACM|nr:hypothetical protein IGI04_024710 [Brassica rapa subsp. trilocularis]
MGTKVILLRRPCEDSCVDELVSGMAVLREISLLDAEALLGRAAAELGGGSLRVGSLVDFGGRGARQL